MNSDKFFIDIKLTNVNTIEIVWHKVELEYGKYFNMFNELFRVIKMIMIFPHSTAGVERTFSSVNYVKNKEKNRMMNNNVESYIFT